MRGLAIRGTLGLASPLIAGDPAPESSRRAHYERRPGAAECLPPASWKIRLVVAYCRRCEPLYSKLDEGVPWPFSVPFTAEVVRVKVSIA